MLVAVLACGLFLQLKGYGGLNPNDFIMLGDQWADASRLPEGVMPNLPHDPEGIVAGFDGQFWYRLALKPWTGEVTEYGITLDFPGHRQQRILYPLLAWVAAGGRADLVPMALIVVNVLGLAALGWLGGAWARGCGRHALWGVLVPLYPGFVLTLALDCTEIVASALVMGALVALTSRRGLLGGVLLALGVLARETSVVMAVAAVVAGWRARAWPGVAALCVYGVWQTVLAVQWGHPPLAETAGINLGFPFAGYGAQLSQDLERGGNASAVASMLWYAAMACVWAWAWTTTPRRMTLDKWGHLGYFVLTTTLSTFIWSGTISVMRQLADFSVLGACVAMRGTTGPRVAALALTVIYWLVLVEEYSGASRLPWFR